MGGSIAKNPKWKTFGATPHLHGFRIGLGDILKKKARGLKNVVRGKGRPGASPWGKEEVLELRGNLVGKKNRPEGPIGTIETLEKTGNL